MENFDQIEKQVRGVDEKVSSILQLLKGNELDKQDNGMIGIQKDHEKRIDRLEKIIDRTLYLLIGISAFAGWGVIDIVQKIILKK